MQQPRSAVTGRPAARRSGESGFALILALLALMLLTFLGLTLATSTSTELRIATNYRWQQQALYNAEAGIEAGKALLRGMNWASILPPQRSGMSWNGTVNPTGACGGFTPCAAGRPFPTGVASRNYEGWPCDKRGNGMGYGVVLDDGSPLAPYQYRTTVFGQTLNGAFTLWVRRPPYFKDNGTITDYGRNGLGRSGDPNNPQGDDEHLILVSEGIAPYTGAQLASNVAAANAAVQVIEIVLSRASTTGAVPCGTRTGQAGQGPEGAGFSACDPVTGEGVAAALGPANQGGRGSFADQTTVY